MRRFLAVGLLLAVSFASMANAATVLFRLDLSGAQGPPGTFTLTARASDGDNAGIAAYSVELQGDILTANHNSLRNVSAQNGSGIEGPVGFTLLRTADVNSPPLSKIVQFAGAQDIPGATPFIVYGLGQTPGDCWTTLGLTSAGVKEGDPWLAEMVIAKGTYKYSGIGTNPGIGFLKGSSLTLASVFTSRDGVGSMPASISTIDFEILIPEPQSAVILIMSMLGLCSIRRSMQV